MIPELELHGCKTRHGKQSDIFVLFALCEGSSYSALDSLLTRQILVYSSGYFCQ